MKIISSFFPFLETFEFLQFSRKKKVSLLSHPLYNVKSYLKKTKKKKKQTRKCENRVLTPWTDHGTSCSHCSVLSFFTKSQQSFSLLLIVFVIIPLRAEKSAKNRQLNSASRKHENGTASNYRSIAIGRDRGAGGWQAPALYHRDNDIRDPVSVRWLPYDAVLRKCIGVPPPPPLTNVINRHQTRVAGCCTRN